MKFEATLWDLDGTLVDSLEDIATSMNRVLERLGLPMHNLETYRGLGAPLRSGEDDLKPVWIKGEIIFARALRGL